MSLLDPIKHALAAVLATTHDGLTALGASPDSAVTWVIGIAGKDNEHLAILSRVAKIFGNKEKVRQLDEARTADEVLDLLGKVND